LPKGSVAWSGACQRLVLLLVPSFSASLAVGQIPQPTDAPPALSPADSAQRFRLPDGFRMELVASEPLIREPSGVCWDERGQCFVCELHGYNLEGQYDVEALNKTGHLDRVVRRLQADEQAKAAAEAETYGTIKRLRDTDGDGRMDVADVWADRLPTCHGLCPANGGLIVAGQAEILFLADRDQDGVAEVREVLFEGFAKGPLERSLNCPQWGPDNWIYVGKGAGGGTIRGPHLKEPVTLPTTDFRIRPDGTAIEPVVGATHTMGFAFTEAGDRLVISTRAPAIQVAPFDWNDLARNPYAVNPAMERATTTDQRVYPTSPPHPWRTRRAEDPAFAKYYTDRYGVEESAPNGYFTSACSPLVYKDAALPGLRGQLLACEPAQNLVHRGQFQRDGVRLRLERLPGESATEFLTSADPWFHAIALSTAPDGSIYVVDFYREIIEDYSAIPRYLQQQYGLDHGKNHGRVWRLTHVAAPPAPPADMSRLTTSQLVRDVGNPSEWRRETARRLLCERRDSTANDELVDLARTAADPVVRLKALQTLEGLDVVPQAVVQTALDDADPGVRRRAVRLSRRWLATSPELAEAVLRGVRDPEASVRLEVALALGDCPDARAVPALIELARTNGNDSWMVAAILSAVPDRGGALLRLLLAADDLQHAGAVLSPLMAAIGARRDTAELSDALLAVAATARTDQQRMCLAGLRTSFRNATAVPLTDSARTAVQQLAASPDREVSGSARSLRTLLKLETMAERTARLTRATQQLGDNQQPLEVRLAAVAELATEDDTGVTATLLQTVDHSTPQVRSALVAALLSRRDRLVPLVDAIAAGTVSATALSAVDRASVLQNLPAADRKRAEGLLNPSTSADPAAVTPYLDALRGPRDLARGEKLFRERCGTCHAAHGVGVAVGPDLSAEFQRAEATLVQDILAPSAVISPGYTTYVLTTTEGQIVTGLLESESASSVTLKLPEGKRQSVLRSQLDELKANSISLMPDALSRLLSPQDVADVIAWVRTPSSNLVLLDDNAALATALNEGDGTVAFVDGDRYSGQLSLRITPLQRHSPRIAGWKFPIREHPGPGEFRYLRFAWKTDGGVGVMLELADAGRWPPAERPLRRYHAGRNTSGWQSREVSASAPETWTVVTRDLWQDFGEFTLTGLAPTALGGPALFDRIELLRDPPPAESAPDR
jgi:putative membrane-bound dehydrogenase-like protein